MTLGSDKHLNSSYDEHIKYGSTQTDRSDVQGGIKEVSNAKDINDSAINLVQGSLQLKEPPVNPSMTRTELVPEIGKNLQKVKILNDDIKSQGGMQQGLVSGIRSQLASAGLVTPPSSTTDSVSVRLEPKTPSPLKTTYGPQTPLKSSFSARRSHIPKPLDVAALCRERQFSGPYSSIPLLSQKKRSHSAIEKTNSYGNEEDGPQTPRTKQMHLPQISPAPYVSHRLSHLQSRLSLPSLKPSHIPRSDLDNDRHSIDGSSRAISRASDTQHPVSESDLLMRKCDQSSNHSECNKISPDYASTLSEFSAKSRSSTKLADEALHKTEKKAKFMYLCEQIWDLIQDD